MSFEKIFQFTMQWEGGSKYTNDSDDPGGGTKYGISQKENPDIDVQNLTEEQAMGIYQQRYWDHVAQGKDDDMDMAAFDSAVNCGVPTVLKWLPTCITWEDVTAMRRQHYVALANANPNLDKYLTGWENRVKSLETFIIKGG